MTAANGPLTSHACAGIEATPAIAAIAPVEPETIFDALASRLLFADSIAFKPSLSRSITKFCWYVLPLLATISPHVTRK
jgi:hypothetical protein